jgi:hypothetical protein
VKAERPRPHYKADKKAGCDVGRAMGVVSTVTVVYPGEMEVNLIMAVTKGHFLS